MSLDSGIDVTKSLEELTGVDWGDASRNARELVRERHALHRVPLRDLNDADLARFLGMGIGGDFLVPVALEKLHTEPDCLALLCAVLREVDFPWHSQPERLADLREIVDVFANQLSPITDDLDRLSQEAALWRLYAKFERRLSMK